MVKALFASKTPPQQVTAAEAPEPGPNTREVGVLEYDPDARLLVFTMPNDVKAVVSFDDLPDDGASFELQLNDTKVGPIVTVLMKNVRLPKFSTAEEAEAWLEAHS